MTVEWRKIDGFPYYEVSNLGIVRSLDKVVKGRGSVVYTKKGRTLKQRMNKFGYVRVGMMVGWNKVKWMSVHRLVAQTFIPNPEYKRTVNHVDGDKQNNHVNNLEWTTQKENVAHAMSLGIKKQAKGIQFKTRTSFDELQIKVIKSMRGSQFSDREIGEYFGVHRITINDIFNRRTWKHVNWPS